MVDVSHVLPVDAIVLSITKPGVVMAIMLGGVID